MTPNLENNSPEKARVTQAVLVGDVIPLFAGRPKREKIIGREDLMDLDILLHTCDSVEELLAKA
jgi:hypothetical protein